MHLDLTYLPLEDRMHLSVRGKAEWLMTRSLLVRLVVILVQKFQDIDLPNVGFPLGQRDISKEHALSLEFDAPKLTSINIKPAAQIMLLQEVTLSVDELGVMLAMRGQGLSTEISLTRKESHLVLEMLAQKAREAKWLQAIELPDWLGMPAQL
jgi:hypothetical protein